MKVVLIILAVVVWPGATAWALSVTPDRGSGLPDLAYDPHWMLPTPPNPVTVEKVTARTIAQEPTTTTATTAASRPAARHTTPGPLPRAAAPRPQPGGVCTEWIAAAGITDAAAALSIIMPESGCNPYAVNRRSGACGVAQEVPCGKSGCALGDGACQVAWMNQYVLGRYGSWSAALSFRVSHGWY